MRWRTQILIPRISNLGFALNLLQANWCPSFKIDLLLLHLLPGPAKSIKESANFSPTVLTHLRDTQDVLEAVQLDMETVLFIIIGTAVTGI